MHLVESKLNDDFLTCDIIWFNIKQILYLSDRVVHLIHKVTSNWKITHIQSHDTLSDFLAVVIHLNYFGIGIGVGNR